MGDIFQEVDEEVRRDRFNKFWKEYGAYVIAAAVALVLGTAASVGWREYNAQRQQEDSEKLVGIIQFAIIIFFAALYTIAPKPPSMNLMFQPIPWFLGGYFFSPWFDCGSLFAVTCRDGLSASPSLWT